MSGGEDEGWQRLDKWLWCARVLRHRAGCARLVAAGFLRINRQPTDKPHARVRVGDVLTVPLGSRVRVLQVLAIAHSRGSVADAARLFRELPDRGAAEDGVAGGGGCEGDGAAAYPALTDPPAGSA